MNFLLKQGHTTGNSCRWRKKGASCVLFYFLWILFLRETDFTVSFHVLMQIKTVTTIQTKMFRKIIVSKENSNLRFIKSIFQTLLWKSAFSKTHTQQENTHSALQLRSSADFPGLTWTPVSVSSRCTAEKLIKVVGLQKREKRKYIFAQLKCRAGDGKLNGLCVV